MSANTTQITVTGMTCNGCATKVRSALEEVPGIAKADVDHESGVVKIDADGSVPMDDLEFDIDEAIERTGYKVVSS